MKSNRINKLLAAIEKSRLDGFLISSPHNRRYFSGFSGSSGMLIISQEASSISTDFRYWEQAAGEAPGFTIFRAEKGLKEWFSDFVKQTGVQKLGFESGDITADLLNTMRLALRKSGVKTRLIPAGNLCDKIRMVKDDDEITLIKRAVSISDAAAEYARRIVRPGMSEIELAWEVESHMRKSGSEPIAFPVICASGANSALPHAKPTQRLINSQEPIVLDFGACVCGYTSDITRTISCGEPDSRFEKLYNIVLSAQQAAIEGIRSGMKARDADSIARSVISNAGYGKYFGHSLGHGIGLEVHEGPFLGPASEDTLEEGMVFTIEPGIYLPGWGGIRIEDNVLLENNQIVLLSKATK
jgi:Xaa-Pro aminopeptidase